MFSNLQIPALAPGPANDKTAPLITSSHTNLSHGSRPSGRDPHADPYADPYALSNDIHMPIIQICRIVLVGAATIVRTVGLSM